MPMSLDPALETLLRRLAELQPSLGLPFIVTLAPGAKAAGIVPFVPTAEADLIRMVAGRMTARQALDLSANAQVQTIEFDGEAHALESLLGRR